MKLSDFIDGLQTLHPHYTDPNGYHISSGHDVFYVHATDHPLSAEDAQRMRDLGWFQENEGAYDPEEGWGAYT